MDPAHPHEPRFAGEIDGFPEEVATSELSKWVVADLSPDAAVQPVKPVRAGDTTQLACEGVLVHGRGGCGAVRMTYREWRKFWGLPLGIADYFSLVRHAVEARARSAGDVELHDHDESDDVVVELVFTIYTQEQRLDRVLTTALAIESELLEVPEAVSLSIADSVEAARKRLNGWGNAPLDTLVDQMRGGTAYDKGLRLEELTSRLFQQVPGFTATGRVNTSTEEIDIRIRNGSDDPAWRQESALLIAECKNWGSSCGRPEFSVFKDKLTNRVGRVKCGFLVSWNGFADTVHKEMLRGSEGETLIVPITGENLRHAVRDDNFPEVLQQLYQDAVFL